MSCFLCVKLAFLEKKEFRGFLEKRSYLQKYTINFDETKSILLLKECSLRIFIWILKFCIENSQEWTNHGRYQVFWDALYDLAKIVPISFRFNVSVTKFSVLFHSLYFPLFPQLKYGAKAFSIGSGFSLLVSLVKWHVVLYKKVITVMTHEIKSF